MPTFPFIFFFCIIKNGLIFIFSSFPFSSSSFSICLLTQSFPLILLGWWSHGFPTHPPSLPNIIFGILTLPTYSLQFVEYSLAFIEHTSTTHDISKWLWILSNQNNWWLEEAYPSIPYHLMISTHSHFTDFSNSHTSKFCGTKWDWEDIRDISIDWYLPQQTAIAIWKLVEIHLHSFSPTQKRMLQGSISYHMANQQQRKWRQLYHDINSSDNSDGDIFVEDNLS